MEEQMLNGFKPQEAEDYLKSLLSDDAKSVAPEDKKICEKLKGTKSAIEQMSQELSKHQNITQQLQTRIVRSQGELDAYAQMLLESEGDRRLAAEHPKED